MATRKKTPKKQVKKRPVKKTRETKIPDIDIQNILLYSRNVRLDGVIDEKMAGKICDKLLALAHINSKPIALWINSVGGCVPDGFAIIDIIKGLTAPVYTFVNGCAWSMAGLIAMSGDKRVITPGSSIMIHDMSLGMSTHGLKLKNEAKYFAEQDERLMRFIVDHSNMTYEQVNKAFIYDGWFWPDECLKYGLVDCVAEYSK